MRYEVFSDTVCPILNLCSVGYAKDPAVTRFGAGVRSLYIVHYVLAGKGYFNGNAVNAGQGFLITPNMKEEYYPDEKSPWEFLWFISNDEKMASVFELFGADENTRIFEYPDVAAARDLSELLKGKTDTIVSSFELLEMFLCVFKQRQNEAAHRGTKTNEDIYTEAAVKYIRLNVHTPLTVAELIRVLGVSQPYLFKLFKKKFQLSPKEYILKQKRERAQLLLKETQLTVTQVANSVGFQDVLSFSRFFKSQTGLSPQNYRKASAI